MIPEASIARECINKTYSRAVNVAKNGGFVYSRRCDYEPDSTIIRACIESSSWSDYPYDVRVTLDEEKGQILDYECTCPAHNKYPGMCKHSAGLTLLFNQEPETFRGWQRSRLTSTSRSIANLMSKLGNKQSAKKREVFANAAGNISLGLTLEEDPYDRWSASFKIESPNCSYVVKNIEELLENIDTTAFHEYGKKLAFTHTLDVFTEQTQEVLKWLARTVNSSPEWQKRFNWQSGNSKRHIYLSNLQVIELLDLYLGRTITFLPTSFYNSKPVDMQILDKDPVLSVSILPMKDGAYQLIRGLKMGFISFQNQLYAWDSTNFYRCSSKLLPCADFLENVYMNGEEKLTISREDAPLFCGTVLPLLQSSLATQVPSEFEALKPIEGKMEFYLDSAGGKVECVPKVFYGEAEYLLTDPTEDPSKPLRDQNMESHAKEVLLRYLPIVQQDFTCTTTDDDNIARLLFHGLEELKRQGEVFTTDAFDKRKASRSYSITTGLSVSSNLINLKVQSEEMSPEEIASLLASYRGKKKYHKLRDGTFIDLEDDNQQALKEIRRLQLIADELDISGTAIAHGIIELEPFHAFLLDSFAEEQEKDTDFKEFVSKLVDGRNNYHEIPPSLQNTLRGYQTEGFNWINSLIDTGLAGILADEMGLGKSLQVISVLLCREKELGEHPALIVCPASLVYNWAAEFKKFAPGIPVEILSGTKQQRDIILTSSKYNVLITSYDTLRMDIDGIKDMQFSYQIIDEAQYIKNHSTKAAQAVKAITANHRIALTGTPVENRLSELWSIFDYLMPGMLGPYKRFRQRYEAPILDGDEEAAQRLSAKVGPFILRRLKREVLDDLPEKLETIVHARLDDEQHALYDAHETRLRRSLSESDEADVSRGKIAVLAELTKLRQICCDPRLLYENYGHPGAKMATISELIETAIEAGEKVLVFSQFTSFLDLIASELTERKWDYYTITGATPKQERMELVTQFNQNDIPVFLISLKAGGTGLNLVGASVVIHADPWWNAAAQNQATDRAHRIGQTRDVSVFKVIADNTIEERIVELQNLKNDLADAVLSSDSTSLGMLSKDELIELLSND